MLIIKRTTEKEICLKKMDNSGRWHGIYHIRYNIIFIGTFSVLHAPGPPSSRVFYPFKVSYYRFHNVAIMQYLWLIKRHYSNITLLRISIYASVLVAMRWPLVPVSNVIPLAATTAALYSYCLGAAIQGANDLEPSPGKHFLLNLEFSRRI